MLSLAGAVQAQSLHFVEAEFDGVGGVDGLGNAHAVTVSPDGAYVYVAAADDDAVAVFARDAGSGALAFVEAEFDGAGGVDGLDGAESVVISPDGAHLYAGGLLDGAVAAFSRDTGTGELTFLQVVKDGDPGINGLAGVSDLALSPDGSHLYAAGRFDDAVAVFARNGGNGLLSFVEVEIDGMGGVDGLSDVTAVAVSPDGSHLYAAGISDQQIAIFARNSSTGELFFSQSVADTLPNSEVDIDDHHGLTMSPDGAFLYATNHVEDLSDGWIATFSRNASSGALTAVPPVLLGDAVDFCLIGIEGDSQLAVHPDGDRAYANLTFDSAVVLFQRNPATGQLTVADGLCDETIGMGSPAGQPDGLFADQAVAASPDGRHVYVASSNLEDAVAVLEDDGGMIFADGFESGDTSAWTAAIP